MKACSFYINRRWDTLYVLQCSTVAMLKLPMFVSVVLIQTIELWYAKYAFPSFCMTRML